jgi:GNAT superfamily N-acetyltransferase
MAQQQTNFDRMIDLVTDLFDTKHDPHQIDVTDADRERLEAIHPACMSEVADKNGPILWLIIIPTTQIIKDRFLAGVISEKELLAETRPGDTYEAIYLCSVAVLPEYRRQGLAKKATLDAIERICREHPIKSVFYWQFTEEGKDLAESVARSAGLPLHVRPHEERAG